MDQSSTTGSRLTLEIVRDIIAKEESNVEIETLEEELGAGRGDNYTSMLYRVRAKGRKQLTNEEFLPWECAIIYKVLPLSQVCREAFKSEILFRNEVAFYTNVWPALDKLQANGKKVFDGVAKIYVARSDLIAMEDLKERGYYMVDRRQGLKLHHLKVVFEALAGFHSLSLTLRNKSPELFAQLSDEKNPDSIREALFRMENEDWYRQYYRAATKNVITMVSETLSKKLEHKRDDIMKKLRNFLHEDVFFREMCELTSAESELTVFCHGDCWTNNILFAEKPSSESEAVCLVDFQLTRVGSLALDLSYLLYCCTSSEIRQKHMTELLGHYHSRLMDNLQTLNPNKQLTVDPAHMWKVLNEEMRRCSRFGAGSAVDMLPISTCASDEAPDVYEEIDDISENPRHSRPPPAGGEACARLMTDLILELIQNRAL